MTELEKGLFNEIWDKLNEATEKGFSEVTPVDYDEDFVSALKHNNAVFAAFKVHRQQNDMAARLTDANGELKPFAQWMKEVLPIANHQNRIWFKTEYDTAVKRAHQAAEWKQFEREADVTPNIEWLRTTAVRPAADHSVFWSVPVILPVNDPFWDRHKPGDRWGCKCGLRATDKPATPADRIPDGKDRDKPAPGLNGNPAKTGQIFNDSHPYNPPSCAACTLPGKRVISKDGETCTAQLIGVLNAGNKKDCYHCSRPVQLMKKAGAFKSKTALERKKFLQEMLPLLSAKVEQTIRVKKQAVKMNIGFTKYGNKHLYSDTFGRAKNVLGKEDLKNLDSILSEAIFVKRVKLYKKRKHDDIKRFYLFKGNINGKTAYLHVAELAKKRSNGKMNYERFLYSITEKK
jgi:hypothetical protein